MTAYLDGYSGYSGVPEDAAAEILEKLMTHQQISSDEVAQILRRYGVCGEPEALQIAYRKKVGQRLIASLRDPYGRREVFSTGSTYVLVDCCNDRDALEHIHKKLDKDMEAVDQASCKIDNRLQVLQRFSRYQRKRKAEVSGSDRTHYHWCGSWLRGHENRALLISSGLAEYEHEPYTQKKRPLL